MQRPNTDAWFKELVPIYMDRISMLTLVAMISLAIKHPRIPKTSKTLGRNLARLILDKLRQDGLDIPRDAWVEYKALYYS
jgi:hypothetical protein